MDRLNRSYASRLRVHTQVITQADLANAVSATAENVALLTLPPLAWLVDYAVYLTTQFAGGTITDMDVSIGTVAGPTLICADVDIDGATAGAWTKGTAGARPEGPDYGGVALVARFTPTGDSNLNLTAGSLTIKLLYAEPDAAVDRG